MNTLTPKSDPVATETLENFQLTGTSPFKPGRVYFILFILYTIFVIYGSLVPLDFRPLPMDQAWQKFCRVPYLDLKIHSRSDLVANFLLFIPLTFVAMGAFTRENHRKPVTRILVAAILAPAASALSVAIEFTQLHFPPRTVSQNDMMAETLGGMIGIALWFTTGRQITRWIRSLWNERAHGQLAVKILGGYAVLLVLYQMFPFDLTISPVEWYHKLKTAKVVIIPFTDKYGSGAYTALSKMAVMIPIGMLLSLIGRHRSYSVARVTLYTFLFACLVEAGQLIVYSRYTSSTDLIYGTFGGLLGALLARVVGRSARRPVLETPFWQTHGQWIKATALVLWVMGVAWQKWLPFNFAWPEAGLAARAQRLMVAPLTAQYYSSEFDALSQVVRELTAFMIMGMLLMRIFGVGREDGNGGKSGKLASFFLLVIIAVPLEMGQLFLSSRVPDITATVVSIVGGALGIWLAGGFVSVFISSGRQSEATEPRTDEPLD